MSEVANNVFIVFQRSGRNGQFVDESTKGILQAPKKDRSGKTPHHWKRMESIKKDDLIFHMSAQKIVAVSIAKDKVHDDSTGNEYIVDSEYSILENKIELEPLRQIIKDECNGFKNGPFNRNGTGNQGYLFEMPMGLSNKLIDEIISNNSNQDLGFLNKYKGEATMSNNSTNSEGDSDMTNLRDKISLNTILYGPPGTGKTYNSKIYAVAICCEEYNGDVEAVKKLDYEKVVIPKYNELVKDGRVAFTTFHQSYGYEEFIEGIKPLLKDDESKDVYYDVVPGLFKKFCDDNRKEVKNLESLGIDANTRIWKMSVEGGKTNIIKECFAENNLRINFDIDSHDSSMIIFRDKMQAGDLVLSFASVNSINGVAQILEGDVEVLDDKPKYKYARKVKWLFKNKIVNIKEVNGGKELQQFTCTGLPNLNRTAFYDLLNKNLDEGSKNVNNKPCVFIIDEINRGNISKIFGELITLIEPSKRTGLDENGKPNPEGMTCILPYSKESFSVPDNIYILGTMNTADRSIALMDTALRRRFDFVEMMPESKPIHGLEVNGINIEKMLDTLNSRIEVLYDREHTLGHAFFMPLWKEKSLDKLASIFKNKIIPLLQEYFYEDYEKIQLVLGDNSKSDNKYKFIKDEPADARKIFKGSINNDDLPEKKYIINSDALGYAESYIEIYK